MVNALLEFLFGCRHQRFSFPQTAHRRTSRIVGTYVACLDCGKEFGYDWEHMKLVRDRPAFTVDQAIDEIIGRTA